MKKILAVLLCVFALANLASQAQAALITDWSYELRTHFTIINEDAVTAGNTNTGTRQISFTSGMNDITMSMTGFKEGTLSSSDETSGIHDIISIATKEASQKGDIIMHSAFTWSFSYTIFPTGNEGAKQELNYKVNLGAFYDGSDGKTYLYYNKDSFVMSGGDSFVTFDGYTYDVSTTLFDNQEINKLENWYGGNNYGWALTSENSPFSLQTAISITPKSAPTPEPATMLLMGLGLAGLGFVARRRNK